MPNRYPATRSGVEQVIRDAFLRAQDYKAALAEAKSGKRKLPPRRDLQLDALVEILEGKRLVHCHSYRQDEILMLMRLAESFGFRINTFTHILEGYKVADEMAAHGASGLGFTDWWAYKFEVYDAIPYNAYLMWDRGVNTGFNSDDPELARRLNTEAAKAVKYGGVPPEEAIKFVTLNPAKSLKIEDRVGSLEVGKDADFSIWSGSPLSPTSTCEQTWIDGRKYFDRAADLAGRASLTKERDDLIAAVRAAKKSPEDGKLASGGKWPPRYLQDGDLSGSDCQGTENGIHLRSQTARYKPEKEKTDERRAPSRIRGRGRAADRRRGGRRADRAGGRHGASGERSAHRERHGGDGPGQDHGRGSGHHSAGRRAGGAVPGQARVAGLHRPLHHTGSGGDSERARSFRSGGDRQHQSQRPRGDRVQPESEPIPVTA